MKKGINLEKIKVLIFDVDGTLYDQSKLRKKVFLELLKYYSVRPWRYKELLILSHFRSERENKDNYNDTGLIEDLQYEWCAVKGSYSLTDVKQIVNKWMFVFPNPYLKKYAFAGVNSFFKFLRLNEIKIAIYSDYKAEDKLKSMDLEADLIVSSTDTYINKLKPNPKGLNYITEYFNVSAEECLFIGDREEMDAQCAINAQMPYMILGNDIKEKNEFYINLEEQFTSIKTPKVYE